MKSRALRILFCAGGGMGGTEKAAYLFGSELARRGHQVHALTDPNSPRIKTLIDSGIHVHNIDQRESFSFEVIHDVQPDILHLHTSGYANQSAIYELLRSMDIDRPIVVETNVFGQLMDFSDQGEVKRRLFVSYTSGMQAFERTRVSKGPATYPEHNVVFNPLPDSAFIKDPESGIKLRHSLGIQDDEILCIRIGRPGGKWKNWECKAFKAARKQNKKLRLLLMEPDESLSQKVKAGRYGDGIIIKKASTDTGVLQSVYNAGDITLHASAFGESYGYTIAEAMAVSMPVITLSTPWGDQAQTELVSHGKNGYICCSVNGMAKALVSLSSNVNLVKEFGESANKHIKLKSSLSKETDVLESIFMEVLGIDDGSTSRARFAEWKRFFLEHQDSQHPECYEIDNHMVAERIIALAYARLRWCKHATRYAYYRFKGKHVYPLNW